MTTLFEIATRHLALLFVRLSSNMAANRNVDVTQNMTASRNAAP